MKSQINNLEQIKGQCYLPMSTHFLNQIGTETTTLNQMLPGVLHMQREVWALYNYSERFEFFFLSGTHMQSPMHVIESSSLWFVSIFCLICNWVLILVDYGLSFEKWEGFWLCMWLFDFWVKGLGSVFSWVWIFCSCVSLKFFEPRYKICINYFTRRTFDLVLSCFVFIFIFIYL